MKRLLLATLCFLIPATAGAQALTSLSSLRVRYNTQKATVRPDGDLKAQIDEVDRQITEATRLGRTGELRRLYAKGTALLAGRGWSDAGEAATSALGYLREQWGATVFARIDPEEFFDFQQHRPLVHVNDQGIREITWPSTEFAHAEVPGLGRDVVILEGVELRVDDGELVRHRAAKQQKLKQHRNDVVDVPIVYRQGAGNEAKSNRQHRHQNEPHRQQQDPPTRIASIGQQQNQHHHQAHFEEHRDADDERHQRHGPGDHARRGAVQDGVGQALGGARIRQDLAQHGAQGDHHAHRAQGLAGEEGAGLRNDGGSPTIRNCRFIDNAAIRGGAIFDSGLPRISDCAFDSNKASFGGALYLTGNLDYYSLIRCAFRGNSASCGGAIYTPIALMRLPEPRLLDVDREEAVGGRYLRRAEGAGQARAVRHTPCGEAGPRGRRYAPGDHALRGCEASDGIERVGLSIEGAHHDSRGLVIDRARGPDDIA